MSKEKDKIFRTLEHIAITFDKFGYSPTIPIFKGHQDFEWLFKLELDTIKALCNQQDQRISELEEQLANSIRPKFKIGQEVWIIFDRTLFGERLRTVENTKIFGINVTDFIDYYFQTLPCIAREEEIFATKEEAQAKLQELPAKSV